jgi:serine/threonine protein kinase/tetratricopeptide (TPR) repeat protein
VTTPDDDPADELERLLAEAVAIHDRGGDGALASFVAQHPSHTSALERGIRRCREMGLLGRADRAAAETEPKQLGDYELVRRIGSGGMGVVFEAIQQPLGRRVALKIIRPELLWFEGARERFRREIDAIAKLEHPSIVAVHDAGERDGVPFYAMELIAGLTLDAIVAQMSGRDPASLDGAALRAQMARADASGEMFRGAWWEIAVRIGRNVALGLRHAHLRGIIHRDVKPSNIMITPHGEALVLDFGVAQVRSARELTRSGMAPGSPAFMSPEQRAGLAIDERTDVFSLAATLWQFLTFERPPTDETSIDPAAASPLPDLRQRHRTAPRELDLVLRTAMDPDRERRYPDMGAFADDLQAVLDRRPIRARPLGLRLRAWRWSQRHRVAASALAFGALALIATIVVWSVVERSARERLEDRNEQLARAQTHLAAEQARTRASLDTSLEALHSVLVRLGNERLLAVPRAQAVAHSALVDAAALFRELLARHPDDEEVRWRAARALQALAMSFERRGDMTNAFAVLEEALSVLGDATDVSPTIRNIRGHAWKTMASWCALTPDRAKLEHAFARAEADFAEPGSDVALQAESLRARSDLASSRSQSLVESREPEAVEEQLRRSVELQRACMALGVRDAKDPSLLVMRITNLAKFYERRQRGSEAEPLLAEAIEIASSMRADDQWPPPTLLLAEAQETLGNVLLQRQDQGAEQLLREALSSRRTAVEQHPEVLEVRIRLGGCLHNFARYLLANRRSDEAIERLEEAREIQESALARSPGHPIAVDFLAKHLEMLAYCHSAKADVAALLVAVRRLVELGSSDAARELRLADYLLRAHRSPGVSAPELLDEAMAALLRAEHGGLTAKQLPPGGLADLESREDYRAWRTRIEARTGDR